MHDEIRSPEGPSECKIQGHQVEPTDEGEAMALNYSISNKVDEYNDLYMGPG